MQTPREGTRPTRCYKPRTSWGAIANFCNQALVNLWLRNLRLHHPSLTLLRKVNPVFKLERVPFYARFPSRTKIYPPQKLGMDICGNSGGGNISIRVPELGAEKRPRASTELRRDPTNTRDTGPENHLPAEARRPTRLYQLFHLPGMSPQTVRELVALAPSPNDPSHDH